MSFIGLRRFLAPPLTLEELTQADGATLTNWLAQGVTQWSATASIEDRVSAFLPIIVRGLDRGAQDLSDQIKSAFHGKALTTVTLAIGQAMAIASADGGEAAFLLELAGRVGCADFDLCFRTLLSHTRDVEIEHLDTFGSAAVFALGKRSLPNEVISQAYLMAEKKLLEEGPAIQLVTLLATQNPAQLDSHVHHIRPSLSTSGLRTKGGEFFFDYLVSKNSLAWAARQSRALPDSRMWQAIEKEVQRRERISGLAKEFLDAPAAIAKALGYFVEGFKSSVGASQHSFRVAEKSQ
jgi:hypothetical protein